MSKNEYNILFLVITGEIVTYKFNMKWKTCQEILIQKKPNFSSFSFDRNNHWIDAQLDIWKPRNDT